MKPSKEKESKNIASVFVCSMLHTTPHSSLPVCYSPESSSVRRKWPPTTTTTRRVQQHRQSRAECGTPANVRLTNKRAANEVNVVVGALAVSNDAAAAADGKYLR